MGGLWGPQEVSESGGSCRKSPRRFGAHSTGGVRGLCVLSLVRALRRSLGRSFWLSSLQASLPREV